MPAHETITRRRLPHWYVPGAAHFVTYRLIDSIPATLLLEWKDSFEQRLREKPAPGTSACEHRERLHKQFFATIDRYLDAHRDLDWLARPEVAALIRRRLYFHDGGKYHLLAFSIMPNHVHVLLQPIGEVEPVTSQDLEGIGEQPDSGSPLASIMHSLKSYTANDANKLLSRSGGFWQHESYDHWARDEDELTRIVEYIANNPMKAGLASEAHHWYFSSAHDRFLHDGVLCGLLPDRAVPS